MLVVGVEQLLKHVSDTQQGLHIFEVQAVCNSWQVISATQSRSADLDSVTCRPNEPVHTVRIL